MGDQADRTHAAPRIDGGTYSLAEALGQRRRGSDQGPAAPGLRRTLQEATERHEQAHERELRLARTGRRPAPASSAKRFLIAGGVLAALVVVARALARGPAGGEAEPDVPPPRPSPPR